jgi:chromosomal replication initiator protein
MKALWEQVLRSLGERLTATAMTKFIHQLKPDALEGNTITLAASSNFVQDWVKDKYQELLEDEFALAAGHRMKVEVRVLLEDRSARPAPSAEAVRTKARLIGTELPLFTPNPRQTFESFVVGGTNRMAGAGAMAVGDFPGVKFNPLFIYSKCGLGKTHLLNAVANRILRTQPNLGVAYMTGQRFSEEYVNSVTGSRVEMFRRSIRSCGVWLLDDIQLVTGRDKTQEEIFHAFNHLHSLGRQIVVCADRPPRELLGTHERLRSRLEMGLVVDIQFPDTETRCAIVMKKAEQEHFPLPFEVALAIAEVVTGNVRHLEGALNKVIAYSSMERLEPSVEMAREICDRYYLGLAPMKPTPNEILDMVCRHYRVESEAVKGQSRKSNIAMARHVTVYMMREILGDSWANIGASLGSKDHTTMMHGHKKIREMMDRDRELALVINGLMNDLYPDR